MWCPHCQAETETTQHGAAQQLFCAQCEQPLVRTPAKDSVQEARDILARWSSSDLLDQISTLPEIPPLSEHYRRNETEAPAASGDATSDDSTGTTATATSQDESEARGRPDAVGDQSGRQQRPSEQHAAECNVELNDAAAADHRQRPSTTDPAERPSAVSEKLTAAEDRPPAQEPAATAEAGAAAEPGAAAEKRLRTETLPGQQFPGTNDGDPGTDDAQVTSDQSPEGQSARSSNDPDKARDAAVSQPPLSEESTAAHQDAPDSAAAMESGTAGKTETDAKPVHESDSVNGEAAAAEQAAADLSLPDTSTADGTETNQTPPADRPMPGSDDPNAPTATTHSDIPGPRMLRRRSPPRTRQERKLRDRKQRPQQQSKESIPVSKKFRVDQPGGSSSEQDDSASQKASTIRGNSSAGGQRYRIDRAEAVEETLDTSSGRTRTDSKNRQRLIDEAHPTALRGPHFQIQVPRRSNLTSLTGQFLAYIGVLGLTVGTAMVIYGHFGGYSQYTPTGWLVTTVAQMLLFLGVINLVSGGIEQTNDDVSARINYLGEQLMRIEQVTEEALRGPRIPAHRYANPDASAEESERQTVPFTEQD